MLPYLAILIVSNLSLGENELNVIIAPKQKTRLPQYSMTNDPEKVWPGGVIHYVMDATLGEFLIKSRLVQYMLTGTCSTIYTCTCKTHTYTCTYTKALINDVLQLQ